MSSAEPAAAHATVRDLAEAIHAFLNFAEGIKAAARHGWLPPKLNR